MSMKPEYFSLTFTMDDYDHDVWLALLSEWPFESFHEEDNEITGYIQDHDVTKELMLYLDEHEGAHFAEYKLEQVPDKNWNEVWESAFNPVSVGDYCFIRAKFHPVENHFRHIITIAPRMAFGTGHHATTYMMIAAMEQIDFHGKRVLDFGCGTGILAILAAKEGAAEVVGVDIQPEAIENSDEHAQSNDVSEVCHFFEGGLDKALPGSYDIILANISRNVILEHIIQLSKIMENDGLLLLSGIMFDDVGIIKSALSKLSMEVTAMKEKDQWVQMTCKKIN